MQNDREKEALLGAQARQALEALAAVPMQISLDHKRILSSIILQACDKLDVTMSERDRYRAALEYITKMDGPDARLAAEQALSTNKDRAGG